MPSLYTSISICAFSSSHPVPNYHIIFCMRLSCHNYQRPLLLTSFNFDLSMDRCSGKCGMKLRIHSQTSMVEIRKWISNSIPHILSTLGIKLIHVVKMGSQLVVASAGPVFNRLSQLLFQCLQFSMRCMECWGNAPMRW